MIITDQSKEDWKDGVIVPSIERILNFYEYENYDIALAMSSSRADPVMGRCPSWVYLNI